MSLLAGLAEAVQGSDYGRWAAQSALAYPAANVVHLLGLVMLVGGIGTLDLRLAGAFRALPPAALSRALTPIAIIGLVLMAASGSILFAADAVALAGSAVFGWKLALISLALANAIVFRLAWRHRIERWASDPPVAGRLMAAGSVCLWLTVLVLGRMIAYS